MSDTASTLQVCVLMLHLKVASSNPIACTLITCLTLVNLMEKLFFYEQTKPATRRQMHTKIPSNHR